MQDTHVDPALSFRDRPVPRRWGWPVRGGGRAAHVEAGVRYAATTSQLCGLFPFAVSSGASVHGVPIGRHMHTAEPIGLDPAEWLRTGLVSNTGVWVQGQPGIGKSSITKRMITGLVGYGMTAVIPGDIKGEYTPLITALGGSVWRIGRGLHALNPLDAGPLSAARDRSSGAVRERLHETIRARRLSLLEALITIVRRGDVDVTERRLLGAALDTAVDGRGRSEPVIPDVLDVLVTGVGPLQRIAASSDDADYRRATRELTNTLGLLCEGAIRGIFDCPSSVVADPHTVALSLDISALDDDDDDVVAAAMLCSWAWSASLIDATHALGLRRTVVQVQDELWRALRVAPGLVERSDRITRLNRHRGVVSFQVTHSLDDLEALPTEADRAKARGMASRNGILLLGGMADKELDGLRRITSLTDGEASLITSWAAPPTWHSGRLHPGRGKYLIKSGERMGHAGRAHPHPHRAAALRYRRRLPAPRHLGSSGPAPAMNNPSWSILRDAAAPLLLLGAIATAGIAAVDVWLAAAVAAGPGPVPALSFDLPLRVARDGIDVVLSPAASTTAFVTTLAALVGVELAAVAGVVVLSTRGGRLGDPRRSLLRRRDLGDLSGRGSARRARHLRPSLDQRGDVPAAERGIRMVRIAGRDVWMSWEDVALVIMGPRANKTSAVAVPAVLSAPGLVVATSNKADLWALTSGLRGEVGAVWTFDPQQIAHAEQRWWWDPLRSVREAPDAHRYEAASRLAEHFMGTIGGTRRDPFFHAAGEQVLVGTLLAAALSGGTLRDVLLWLQYGRRDAITALDNAGAGLEAADLEASLAGADVTTKGIFQTARTATKALTSERILRWITPPETWRTPPRDPQRFLELDPWHLLAEAAIGPVTSHLLSKEGAGTAAPVVAALVDRILEVAELSAQARGGRLDPPVVAVLDEAANICPIKTLPQLYSHFGSRGIQVITMLQSYQQGVGVWGNQGMDALWSAATVKLVGAGVDDHEFLRRLSGLVGDHDVEKMSTSYDRSRGPSRQYSTTREPVLPVSVLRALPRSQAVLLATGRRAGLGELQPWYQENDAVDIRTYSTVALAELRAAAQEALGSDNPFTTSAGTSTRGGEPS